MSQSKTSFSTDEQEQNAPKKKRMNVKEKHREASTHLVITKAKAAREWLQHGASSNGACETRGPKIVVSDKPNDIDPASNIHSSHHKMMIRNTIFCKRCGCWGSKKTQKLADKCLGVPSNNDSKCKLRRMMGGRHPDRKVLAWSDGLSTSVITPPTNLDGE